MTSVSWFMPSVRVTKKPRLPSVDSRRLKSPASAACISVASSSSAWTSAVRSTHSTTEPRRTPSALVTGLATSAKVRPPSLTVARCSPRNAPSTFRWWAGFLWKASKFRPTRPSTRKDGRSLRMSCSALRSMPRTASLQYTIWPSGSATMMLVLALSSALRTRRLSSATALSADILARSRDCMSLRATAMSPKASRDGTTSFSSSRPWAMRPTPASISPIAWSMVRRRPMKR